MPADTSVKYFHSEMPGAPAMSGTAGTLISVLDACLVDGFGLKSVDSLVIAGNVATMTISSGHSFELGSVALVAGVTTPAAINAQHRVTAVTGTTVSFETTGIADQTATGTITTKLAPAGWSKAFSGTNLAAYKQIDPASSQMYLRVDDTGAQFARVVGYETMSDVNTGANPFPLAAQLSGGGYIPRSNASSTATRKWIVIADSRSAYIFCAYHSSNADAYTSHFFGDHVSRKVSDAYSCAIIAETSNFTSSANAGGNTGDLAVGGGSGSWLCRDYNGLGQSIPSYVHVAGAGSSSPPVESGGNAFPQYPSPIDGVLQTSRTVLREASSALAATRGELPGFLWSLNYIGTSAMRSKSKVAAEGALAGRTLLPVEFSGSNASRFFIDITGPWR